MSDKKPHTAVWILDRDESVFGLKKVNAVLACKVCGARRGPPEILPFTDFDISGKTILTYTLKEASCPTVSH